MRKISLSLFLCLLAGCATTAPSSDSTTTLQGLQSLGQAKETAESKGLTSIRTDAIEETALSVGAQAGLAYRAKQINAQLTTNATTLDHAFNFSLMMLPHNVLPPVLAQGNATLNLADDNNIRVADRIYQIVTQARFVTTPPTWRTYLWLPYTSPDVPDNSLLPKNATERAMWKQYSAEGWNNGITQANNIYTANLALLKRDFTGMVLYRVLLTQHMVSPPYVATTNLGITGDDSNLRINDQVLRITALPSLQTNTKLWKPAIIQ